jgi:hypothetical protein
MVFPQSPPTFRHSPPIWRKSRPTTADLTGGLQIPTSAKPANVPDFPLAVVGKAGRP